MTRAFGDPEGVRRQGRALLAAGAGVGTVTDDLSGKADALVPGHWYGQGAQAFVEDYAGRARQAVQLGEVCAHIGQVLIKLADELEAASAHANQAQQLTAGPQSRFAGPATGQQYERLMGEAEGMAQAAWAAARARLAGIQVPGIGSAMTVPQVNAWATRLAPPPRKTPWYEALLHTAEHYAGDAGRFVEGNAGQLAQMSAGLADMLGGGALTLAGLGGEAGGAVLDVTGVGAAIGVPVNIASAGAIGLGVAGMASGAGLFEHGATHLNMSAGSAGGDSGDAGQQPPEQSSPSVSGDPPDAPNAVHTVEILGPKEFNPGSLRGLTADEVRASIPSDWVQSASKSGGGEVFRDPAVPGRQIRIMPGYPPGSRPDLITTGPYAVVSQNGVVVKVPLSGNPVLP